MKLTEIEINQLVKASKNGDELAFEKLLRYYTKKIRTFASKITFVEDAEQEGYIMLWKAVKDYQIGHNTKFNTYFWMIYKQHITMLSLVKTRYKRGGENVTTEDGTKMKHKKNDLSLNKTIIGKDKNKIELYELIVSNINEMREKEFEIGLEQLQEQFDITDEDMQILKWYMEGEGWTGISQKMGISQPAVFHRAKSLRKKNGFDDFLKDLTEKN